MSNTYTCASCGEMFKKGWSDEEAEAEYGKVFAEAKAASKERAVVCDDCYTLIMGE